MSINLENIIKKKSLLLAFKAFFQKVEINIPCCIETILYATELKGWKTACPVGFINLHFPVPPNRSSSATAYRIRRWKTR